MTSLICLNSLGSLSAKFLAQLEDYRSAFQNTPCLAKVLQDPNIRQIANALENHLKQQRIIGYHCTREPCLGFYKERGLRLTNVRNHQTEFLNNFGDRFSATEISQIQEAWFNYFEREGQQYIRENQIWTCLTLPNGPHDGTENFFKYFGGEVIFKPLMNMPKILEKLGEIGYPVIVEIELPANELHINGPMSHAVLSLYHRTIRSDAYPSESEACFRKSVPPSKIIRVTPLNQFQS